jgi:RNA polymerase sigma factor for flagellar operon FliA
MPHMPDTPYDLNLNLADPADPAVTNVLGVEDIEDPEAPPLPHNHEEWVTYIEDGRPHGSPLEEHLARSYAPLTLRALERVRTRFTNADPDELVSNAYFGLMHAIRTFDPGRGTKFESWAFHTMVNRISEGQRGADWISKHRRANIKRVAEAEIALAQRGMAFPTDAEVAAEALISVDAVDIARSDASISRVGSIDHLAEYGNNAVDAARPVAHGAAVESLFDEWGIDGGLSDHFWDAVRMLPDRPKQVLAMYVWGGYEQEEIAAVFSVSHSRVSQIFKDTAKRLRQNMETLAATP